MKYKLLFHEKIKISSLENKEMEEEYSLYFNWHKTNEKDEIIPPSNEEIFNEIIKQLKKLPIYEEYKKISSYGTIDFVYDSRELFDFTHYSIFYVNVIIEITDKTQKALFLLKYN